MSKAFFFPALPDITPSPKVITRTRSKRSASAPAITPEMTEAEIKRIRTLQSSRLKRAAERVNKYTEQITSEQWHAGVDRRASIKGGSAAFRSMP